MSLDQVAAVVWARRWLFLATFLACVAAAVAVTYALPKTYEATATLFAGNTEEVNEALAFDTNVGEQLARTFNALAANPNVADEVRERLPFDMTRTELQAKMAFAPVERTQLLEITAEGSSPGRAQTLANTYAEVFSDRVEQQFERGDAPTKVAISEPAARPTEAAKPKPALYIGFGVVLALILALGVTLLRERLDNRIRVAEDDDSLLGLPILGRIPDVSGRAVGANVRMSDAFRLLKTNLDFAEEERAQVIGVTSPSPVEGKSTVSSHLAVTMVADGERVVLIEMDLRRPGLGNTEVGFGIERPEVGLTNHLAAGMDISEIISPHPRLTGLDIIWSGPLPPNPTALLGSRRVDALLESLLQDYDRVIVDTSPVSVGADASVALAHVDSTLYVIDARSTKRSAARAGLNQLENARAHVLGVVLNRASGAASQSDEYYTVDGKRPTVGEPARRKAKA